MTAEPLLWQRHHHLFGADLRVGVQTVVDMDWQIPEDYPKGMVKDFTPGGIRHIFHPAVRLSRGDLRDNKDVELVFVPQLATAGCRYHQLVLSRKDRGERTPWAVAARFPNEVSAEREVFGFSALNSRDDFFLNLALPGKAKDESGKPVFVPVYVKLEYLKVKGNFFYFEIFALQLQKEEDSSEESPLFGVLARLVDAAEVPEILRRARPPRRPR